MRNPFESARSRSLGGLALAAVIVPFLLALTGCLTVPIGDPEKSQIDPALSGVWLADEGRGVMAIWMFEAYDPRTWLITRLESEQRDQSESTGSASAVLSDALMVFEREDALLSQVAVFKAWLATLAGARFLVLEPKLFLEAPEHWLAFGVANKGNDTLELRVINFELDGLGNAESSAEAEAVIARNLANPELLRGEPWVLTRLPETDYGRVKDVLQKFNIGTR